MRLFVLLGFFIFSFVPIAMSGEWTEEEIRQMEEERRVYEETFNQFNSRGLAYQVWLKLSRSSYGCVGYDYFPESGLRGFYCHLNTFTDMRSIENYAGKKIFLSGPHADDTPNFNSYSDFGHYNPDFLLWAEKYLIPARQDSQFLKFTQTIYNELFSHLIRAYYVVGVILDNNNDLKEKLTSDYKKAMSDKRHYRFFDRDYYFIDDNLPQEFKYIKGNDFSYPQFQTYNFEGNIVKTGLYFWLRRDVDGTFKKFLEMTESILVLYDKKFLDDFKHLNDQPVFYKLAGNLDAAFQPSDLKKLSRNQLSFLRNGIYATYGYSFQNENLRLYFQSNTQKFCRKKQCGVVTPTYREKSLNDTDRSNLKAIREIETSLAN